MQEAKSFYTVMDAIEYATIVLDQNTKYDDEFFETISFKLIWKMICLTNK